jgi:hypothetical protein
VVENSILDNLYSKPVCHKASRRFRYPRIPQLQTCYC